MAIDEAPGPAFPGSESPILEVIVKTALGAYERGEASVQAAIMNAAVNAWAEGHIEGEESCPGCW